MSWKCQVFCDTVLKLEPRFILICARIVLIWYRTVFWKWAVDSVVITAVLDVTVMIHGLNQSKMKSYFLWLIIKVGFCEGRTLLEVNLSLGRLIGVAVEEQKLALGALWAPGRCSPSPRCLWVLVSTPVSTAHTGYCCAHPHHQGFHGFWFPKVKVQGRLVQSNQCILFPCIKSCKRTMNRGREQWTCLCSALSSRFSWRSAYSSGLCW